MSKGARFALGLVIILVGVGLIAAVSTIVGAVVIALGVIVMPWFPGMGE
jgi:hypothetical protein